jgi:hypothetical protein
MVGSELRLLRLSLACYFAALVGWYLPTHTRGLVRVADSGASWVSASCCGTAGSAERSPGQPSSSDRKLCAVCFWSAALLPAAPLSFDFAYREQLFAFLAPPPAVVHLPSQLSPSLPRGPPGSA